jgi:hypothetical protein
MIENIVLNTGIVIAGKEIFDLEEYEENRFRSHFYIGDAEVRFRITTHTRHFQHFGDFKVRLNGSEFFLDAQIWGTNQSGAHSLLVSTISKSIFKSESPIQYNDTDIVLNMGNGDRFLFKNMYSDPSSTRKEAMTRGSCNRVLTKKLSTKSATSCFVMRYNWIGDIEAFKRELMFERLKSGLEFEDFFSDATILDWRAS